MIIYLFIKVTRCYAFCGFAYSLVAYIFRAYQGKESTLNPLIGVLLDVIGWPWMVYADIRHIGLMPQDIAALGALLLGISSFFIRRRNNPN